MVLFTFVVYEAALRILVGGSEVMRRQLFHVLEVGQLRNVSVQVLPIGRASYHALSGPVVPLETPDHERFAYVEGQETGALYTDPGDVLKSLDSPMRCQGSTL